MAVTLGSLFLPALQGSFGDRTYYSALMRLDDLVRRVGYATLLQNNDKLAEQIQRRLDDKGRAEGIAQYLSLSNDRFFNAIVVGVLGGQPEWHAFSLSSRVSAHEMGAVTERDQDLVGYLHLNGEERMFALDGQHRLAGIRRALEETRKLAEEKISVIFVPHVATTEGLIRTRSLFVSLNKKAVPVKRKDIIILDEVDLAAIVTRRIVDGDPRFDRGVIDVERFGNAIPTRSRAWTTIGNLYDANRIIIRQVVEGHDEEELDEAEKVRLPDDRIDFYQRGVLDFYERLSRVEPLLAVVLGRDATVAGDAVVAARTRQDPRLLARPIGLKIVAKVAGELRRSLPLDETFREVGRIPASMTRVPFAGVIWEAARGTIRVSGESLAVKLLLYMLGRGRFDDALRRRYAEALGEDPEDVRAPRRLPAAR